MLLGFPLFLLVRRRKLEVRRTAWIWVYILGIILVSYLGDTNFVFANFLPISPLGIITMPYDIVVLASFAVVIYIWAFVANTKPQERKDNRAMEMKTNVATRVGGTDE